MSFPLSLKTFLQNFLLGRSTTNCLHFHFSENIFISPLSLKDFSLDIKFQIACFFSTLKVFYHFTTSFVPDEMWPIIYIIVLLYVIYLLALAAFNVLVDFQLFSMKCLGVIFLVFILRFADLLSSLFVFHLIWETISHYLFKYFSCHILLSSEITITYILFDIILTADITLTAPRHFSIFLESFIFVQNRITELEDSLIKITLSYFHLGCFLFFY